MRRSPHELTRAPDSSLGRGFVTRSGHPFSRTPGSTAAPRHAQAPPTQGTGRQRFPEVIAPLRDGQLCMSTTAELAPRQDPPTRDLVTRVELDRGLQLVEPSRSAPGRSPMAPPPPPVTATPTATATPPEEPVQTFGLLPAQAARIAAPTTRDDVEPLTADLRRLHVTASRKFLQELEQARDGLSHAIPNATTEQVLQAALLLLLEKQARARGQVKRPRAARRDDGGRKRAGPSGVPARILRRRHQKPAASRSGPTRTARRPPGSPRR